MILLSSADGVSGVAAPAKALQISRAGMEKKGGDSPHLFGITPKDLKPLRPITPSARRTRGAKLRVRCQVPLSLPSTDPEPERLAVIAHREAAARR